MSTEHVVFVAAADEAVRERMTKDLVELAGGAFEVQPVASAGKLLDGVGAATVAGALVPLVLVHRRLEDGDGVEALIELERQTATRTIRKVLLADEVDRDEFVKVMQAGALDGSVTVPWSGPQLRGVLFALLTEYFVEEAPDEIDEVVPVMDVDVLSHAFAAADDRRRAAEGQRRVLQRSFLVDRDLSDDEVEQAMIAELDATLGTPPRTVYPEGTVILNSGDEVGGIRVVLDGQVRLTLPVDGEQRTFHWRTAGRIIGLMSIAHGDPSFFTVVAHTDVTCIELSMEELDRALVESPTLAVHFVSVVLRSLIHRSRRSAALQTQVRELAADLAEERDRLTAALDTLGRTQSRLVESEKLATLGQLVAGIGHELNNPIAAITRAADHLAEDAVEVARTEDDVFVAALDRARTSPPMSTRDERAARRSLGTTLGDPALAGRLVRIGITTGDEVERAFAGVKDRDAHLAKLERYHGIGAALRNIKASADRVAALVKSLRSYARSGDERDDHVDVRDGLEESLLLLGHELQFVDVERDYGDVPAISAEPGRLNQVWTNLISNAVQAMDGSGSLRVVTGEGPGGGARVQIIDSGPGIPDENVERIFEPNFTTKAGRVAFGLGLGLQIVKDIVVRHGGSIDVESRPGRTCFTVDLPVDSPPVSTS